LLLRLYVSGSLSTHHQEFLAVHRHRYIFADLMTVCYQEQDAPDDVRSYNLKKSDYYMYNINQLVYNGE